MSNLDAFQVLADPSRRQILQLLAEEPRTINSIAQNFEMSRPAVSKHLKVLHQSGFINIQDVGRKRYCTLKREGFKELQDWISFFDSFWLSSLQKLETILNDRQAKKEVP